MRASIATHVRASVALHATLFMRPSIVPIGSLPLKRSLQNASAWTNKFAASLGCQLLPASAPTAISTEFDRVSAEDLPLNVQALLRQDPADGVVKLVNKSLSMLQLQGREVAVDDYVTAVLRGCELDDGRDTLLMRQESLTFPIGNLKVVCKPDHVLRCRDVMDVVTQESKMPSPKALAWGQIYAELIAAALTNSENEPGLPPPPVFGIRVVGTRWTFLRAEFSQQFLDRLEDYTLTDEDRVPVHVWGGAMEAEGTVNQSDSVWGLDYTNEEERKQLMQMILALRREAQAIVQKQRG